ncbi:hypothetical protein PsYK624_122850 [Phanerochaete sordida]|uniref:Uncharacterized protein n=1 Tax=Phanerochaete sordida TaxID=48140 RepID=A0A9P3GJ40_9APHY|nr:hypothetical protein PsYK624_122850 [Phanerochaete sordida]
MTVPSSSASCERRFNAEGVNGTRAQQLEYLKYLPCTQACFFMRNAGGASTSFSLSHNIRSDLCVSPSITPFKVLRAADMTMECS